MSACFIIRQCPRVLLLGGVRVFYYKGVSACFIIRQCPRVLSSGSVRVFLLLGDVRVSYYKVLSTCFINLGAFFAQHCKLIGKLDR